MIQDDITYADECCEIFMQFNAEYAINIGLLNDVKTLVFTPNLVRSSLSLEIIGLDYCHTDVASN